MLIARGLAGGEAPERWVARARRGGRRGPPRLRRGGRRRGPDRTFGAHPVRLARAGLDGRAAEVATAAVALARDAGARFVIGDVGPSGDYLPPVGRADAGRAGRRASSGSPRALAARRRRRPPRRDDERPARGRDRAGGRAARGPRRSRARLAHLRAPAARLLHDHGRPARRRARASSPRTARRRGGRQLHARERRHARAGARGARRARPARSSSSRTPAQPILEAGGTRYAQTPEEFAADLAAIAALGVAALGGCCGTDPRFIAALAARLGPRRGEPAVTGAEGAALAAVDPARPRRGPALPRLPGWPRDPTPARRRRARPLRSTEARALARRARGLPPSSRRARRRRRAAAAARRRAADGPRCSALVTAGAELERRGAELSRHGRSVRGAAASTPPAARPPRRPPTASARRWSGRPPRRPTAERLSCRVSPGYGDWPLAAQRLLFDLLPHAAIGVELLPSLMMRPAQVDLLRHVARAPTAGRCRASRAATTAFSTAAPSGSGDRDERSADRCSSCLTREETESIVGEACRALAGPGVLVEHAEARALLARGRRRGARRPQPASRSRSSAPRSRARRAAFTVFDRAGRAGARDGRRARCSSTRAPPPSTCSTPASWRAARRDHRRRRRRWSGSSTACRTTPRSRPRSPPGDVPREIGDRWRLYVALALSGKPVVTGTFRADGFAPMHAMLAAVRGGERELARAPAGDLRLLPEPAAQVERADRPGAGRLRPRRACRRRWSRCR